MNEQMDGKFSTVKNVNGKSGGGQRLTAFMISKKIPDAAVPMSLLADHPNVQFNYYRGGLGSCDVEMH